MAGAATITTGNITAQEKINECSQCDTNVLPAMNGILAIADATAHVTPD
jgi:hypothetical protein